ncbi:MAG: site-specific integrase [Chlamydiota bacterium]
MASVEKRVDRNGKVSYRAQVRLKGHPRITATFKSKRDALNWGRKTEVEMQYQHFKPAPPKSYLVADLIDRYLETTILQKFRDTNRDTAKLMWWKKEIGYLLLSNLTPAVIAEKRDFLLKGLTYRKTKRSPSTVNRYLASLSHALTIAMQEWGWLESSPMKRVRKLKEPRGRVRFLSEKERETLLTTCKQSDHPYLYTIVILALSTGMRRGEITNLRWENVNFDLGYILIEDSKNGDRRSVSLKGKAYQLVEALKQFQKQDFGFLFPSLFSKNKPADLRWFWDQAVEKSGIRNFRFHDLRHSAASYLAMSGATPSEIAEVLGHRTLQMVKRYAHISRQHSAKVIEKMNEKFIG